jgi:hypothetical protein
MRRVLSRITRSGDRPPSNRVVNSGSSVITVLTPTRIASWMWRRRCATARDSSDVIHRDSPPAVAILPSSDAANLAVTKGSPVVTCLT